MSKRQKASKKPAAEQLAIVPINQVASAEQPGLIPIFAVAFRGGMWWHMDAATSRQLYEASLCTSEGTYTEGHRTYIVDFNANEQRNVANNRRRTVRLMWMGPNEIDPAWTGQIPKS